MPNDPDRFMRAAVLYATSRGITLGAMSKHVGTAITSLWGYQKRLIAEGSIEHNGSKYVIREQDFSVRPLSIYTEAREMALYDTVLDKLDPAVARIDRIRCFFQQHEELCPRGRHLIKIRFERRPMAEKRTEFNSRSVWDHLPIEVCGPDTPTETVVHEILRILEH